MNSNLEFEFKRKFNNKGSNIKHQLKVKKERPYIGIKSIHGIYSNKNKDSTSIYELTLELKNKSKTQARQYKNYPKNYHKLFSISRSHDKKITLSN